MGRGTVGSNLGTTIPNLAQNSARQYIQQSIQSSHETAMTLEGEQELPLTQHIFAHNFPGFSVRLPFCLSQVKTTIYQHYIDGGKHLSSL